MPNYDILYDDLETEIPLKFVHPRLCSLCEDARELQVVNKHLHYAVEPVPWQFSISDGECPQHLCGEYVRADQCYYHRKKHQGLFELTVDECRAAKGIFDQREKKVKWYRYGKATPGGEIHRQQPNENEEIEDGSNQ